MIIGKKKDDAVELDDSALESVSGGLIIAGTGKDSPEFIPSVVIDDRTLEVIGRTDSAEDAVKLAQSLGVSTERITDVEYENMKTLRKDRMG